MWLAPTQIKILTLNDEIIPYAKEVKELLEKNNIRVELDDRAETIGYKIREANGKYKIPMQIIIGKSEAENNQVNVRRFGERDQNTMSLEDFVSLVKKESNLKVD